MRKLASIKEINKVFEIPGADSIEGVGVDGWECVAKKGEFKLGDRVVYVEIDSIMPEIPEFEFLRSRKFRIKTIKLKGQISQGLVLPMSILPKKDYYLDEDVTDIIGIKKYDPQLEKEMKLQVVQKVNPILKFMMKYRWFRRLFGGLYAKKKPSGVFPEWINKTDETRIQNKPGILTYAQNHNLKFLVTEKLDGQSATYFVEKNKRGGYNFGVCSRNLKLPHMDNSSYWTIAIELDIQNVLTNLAKSLHLDKVVLQGEICGNKIQGNKYNINGYKFFAFNLITIIDDSRTHHNTSEIGHMLYNTNISTVPILGEIKLPDSVMLMVEQSIGKSAINPKQEREGIVVRNNTNNISFKVINPNFLLKEKD